MAEPDKRPSGKRFPRWVTVVLVAAGRHSPAARRWIMARAWDDYHRQRDAPKRLSAKPDAERLMNPCAIHGDTRSVGAYDPLWAMRWQAWLTLLAKAHAR